MILAVLIELTGHVCGRGPSEVDAPPDGEGVRVGEGCVVAVGVGMEAFTVGVCPTCGEDAPVQAARSNGNPISIPMRHSCLIFIIVAPMNALTSLPLSETNTENAALQNN